MKLEIIPRPLANLFVAVAAFGTAVQLYRTSAGKRRSLPIITVLIIGSTALITGLQFVFPEVLTALRRNREALLAGEWWRMVTPLFVQAYGWWHGCVNLVAAVIFCPLAERLYGKKLLALYFIPGVLGQIFGYLWSPYSAGSSLGLAGVTGGLFVFVLFHRRELPRSAQLFAIGGIAGAVVLCLCGDIHGPPTILGALLASILRDTFSSDDALSGRATKGISPPRRIRLSRICEDRRIQG